MITLTQPCPELRSSWWASALEFGPVHRSGYSTFAFTDEQLASDAGFEEWLQVQRRNRTDPPQGFVPATMFWIVDDQHPDEVLGALQLRHELNESLLQEGGHIGYGVRPSARRRGVATGALWASLPLARAVGIEAALVTCDDDNLGSLRTIEKCGGILEDVRAGKRRYWIDLEDHAR
ncbi:GNAT family N-acetyltransferase [Dermacoccaceae bacterium W4C1]